MSLVEQKILISVKSNLSVIQLADLPTSCCLYSLSTQHADIGHCPFKFVFVLYIKDSEFWAKVFVVLFYLDW